MADNKRGLQPGLTPLYDAKTMLIDALASQVKQNRLNELFNGPTYLPIFGDTRLTACESLWLSVIEQAVFDAYLHESGGNYQSVIWVKDAREYFDSKDFEWVCELIGIEPDWVRRFTRKIEKLARKLRGKEYTKAVIAKPTGKPKGPKQNHRQRTMNL